MKPSRLSSLLLQHREDDFSAPASEALDGLLEDFVAEARASWPEVTLSDEIFVPYVGQRLAPGQSPDLALARLRGPDLYLACACARGSSDALAAFEKHFVPKLRFAVDQAKLPGIQTDEMVQRVRARLLVAEKGQAKRIEQYTGRGDLGRWLGVVAVREALMRLRKTGKEERASTRRLDLLLEDDTDPELLYLQEMYREAFEGAFAVALATLENRERNLLRYHYLDGLTIEQVAAIYRVARSTAARWLAMAREHLFTETRETLRRNLPVTDTEFRSLVRLLRSQLDVSVPRLLKRE